ncbi:MAG: type I-E CRISPR-associated protein Cas6/Cse3/CasE [Spirochaetia bacterium]|nr:type I-E CRISPR-associated protein Cas6/Cse3/CasE [Spirochaetia bacterium]
MSEKIYMTQMLLDLRQRATQNWLRNPYRIHQRLWMAMPDTVKNEHKNKNNLKIKHRLSSPFLFRLEPDFIKTGKTYPRILVYTKDEIDWHKAFDDTKFLINNGIITKAFETSFFNVGNKFLFDVRLNPTKKIKNYRLLFQEELKNYPEKHSFQDQKKYLEGKTKLEELIKTVTKEQRERLPSKRVGIYEEIEQIKWFTRENDRYKNSGIDFGFEIIKVKINTKDDKENHLRAIKTERESVQLARKKNNIEQAHNIKSLIVDFSGILRVTDPDKFRFTLTNGIGRAKAFGCGLLLLKRI